jgi:hypothetical protein
VLHHTTEDRNVKITDVHFPRSSRFSYNEGWEWAAQNCSSRAAQDYPIRAAQYGCTALQSVRASNVETVCGYFIRIRGLNKEQPAVWNKRNWWKWSAKTGLLKTPNLIRERKKQIYFLLSANVIRKGGNRYGVGCDCCRQTAANDWYWYHVEV